MPEARRSPGSPTVRRRELGAILRVLRNGQGLTVDQVAAELLCSPSKVSRMETGQRGATLRDVRDLCDLYEVTEAADRERLMTLAREGKQQGWWQSFSLPYTAFVGLEQEANSIVMFHSAVVPGLLQVASYSRAIHLNGLPRLDDAAIEERLEERRTRQELLTRENPPDVEVMLDEAVLHRPIGGSAVMREQLDRILEVADYPNVALRVVPFRVGAHPALESNFIILNFAGQASTIVYVEGLVGHIYLERQADVDRYLLAAGQLHKLALDSKDSALLVASIRDSYTNKLRCAGKRLQSVAFGPKSRRVWVRVGKVSLKHGVDFVMNTFSNRNECPSSGHRACTATSPKIIPPA